MTLPRGEDEGDGEGRGMIGKWNHFIVDVILKR